MGQKRNNKWSQCVRFRINLDYVGAVSLLNFLQLFDSVYLYSCFCFGGCIIIMCTEGNFNFIFSMDGTLFYENITWVNKIWYGYRIRFVRDNIMVLKQTRVSISHYHQKWNIILYIGITSISVWKCYRSLAIPVINTFHDVQKFTLWKTFFLFFWWRKSKNKFQTFFDHEGRNMVKFVFIVNFLFCLDREDGKDDNFFYYHILLRIFIILYMSANQTLLQILCFWFEI